MDHNIFALSGLINGIFALGFGFFIIYKNWRGRINQLFFLLTIAISIWSFGYWQWLLAGEITTALFWVRILSIGATFIPIFYFHWITVFLGMDKNKRLLIKTAYAASFFLLIFSFSKLFVGGVRPKLYFLFWPEPGILYHFYVVLIYCGIVTYAIFLLIGAYLKSTDDKKRGQIFYVILGTISGFGGGITNFFLWYNIPIAPYGNFLGFLFPFFFGYSIIRYGMFNIKVVATELLTFVIWAAVLVATITAPTTQRIIFDGILLIFVVFFGVLLIRSVIKEVEQRENLEKLTLKLEAANERLKQLDEAKSEFLSIASHQLRTPLTTIKGVTSMLLEEFWGKLNEEQKKHLDQIYQSEERLLKLVEDLLDISRIEAGRMQFNLKPTSLEKLVEEQIKELMPMAIAKNLQLRFIKFKSPLPKVLIDKHKIEQVVQNLIDNAIKYTDAGEIIVNIEPIDDHLLFSIRDTGAGVPKSIQPFLFEKFQRGSRATARYTEGAGLGLYWAGKIIAAHKGKIWVESEGENEGSTFSFTLPIKQSLRERSAHN